MPPETAQMPGPSPVSRTRIANGSAVLAGVDGRTLWARRYKEVLADHISDLGGADHVSASELAIIRRAAAITVECERMEAEFASAGQADPKALDLHQRASGSLRRLLESVGLKRRPKPVNADLGAYLEGKAR